MGFDYSVFGRSRMGPAPAWSQNGSTRNGLELESTFRGRGSVAGGILCVWGGEGVFAKGVSSVFMSQWGEGGG